tara:strand:+ start:62 stop:376 length:315 start_codon:yes stop_codon:yes gene_type:complete
MKIFEEKILIENDILTIKISCDLRSHVDIPKSVYREDVDNLIPDRLKDNVTLISQPEKYVSNINSDNYITCGVWKFKITEKKQPSPKQASAPRKTTRKKPLTKK